jgi:Predicted nucleic acid-binding protein, contains PIN domain
VRVYCDTSVLADLLLDQPSSRATRNYLNSWQQRGSLVSSGITAVELARMVMRESYGSTPASLRPAALPLAYLDVGNDVLRKAAALPVRFLKSLDAIHVASALLVSADVVLTRDRQMQRACEELGLAVAE